MADRRVLETTLELDAMEELFVAPTTSPLAANYRPHSYTSAIEFIAGELYAETSITRVRATFVLPPAEVDRAAAIDLPSAIGRYSAAKLRDLEQDVRGTYWRGRRATVVAVAGLFLFVGLATFILEFDGLLPEVIGEGLFIAGWVLLWWPLETLFFDIWEHRLDQRIWRAVSDMEVTVIGARASDVPSPEPAPA